MPDACKHPLCWHHALTVLGVSPASAPSATRTRVLTAGFVRDSPAVLLLVLPALTPGRLRFSLGARRADAEAPSASHLGVDMRLRHADVAYLALQEVLQLAGSD